MAKRTAPEGLQQKRPKLPIHGVLLLDKSAGLSSNQALQQVKRLYSAAKAGHTGSLDPIATGLLPICFGEATKFSRYLLDADKSYRAIIRLGITTTTGDSEGEATGHSPVTASPGEVEQALAGLCGRILQMPPMYSALKHQGKPLYEYARAGIEIEREARDVTIHSIELCDFSDDLLEIFVACSKGTYIRTLAENIGVALGCGAHITSLRREKVGGFDISVAYSIRQLEEMSSAQHNDCLLPVDCMLTGLASMVMDDESVCRLRKGQPVWNSRLPGKGMLRLYGQRGDFVGVGEVEDGERVAPRRLLA